MFYHFSVFCMNVEIVKIFLNYCKTEFSPIRQGNFSYPASSSFVTPHFPAMRESQAFLVPTPRGQTIPMPVITTRRPALRANFENLRPTPITGADIVTIYTSRFTVRQRTVNSTKVHAISAPKTPNEKQKLI